MLGERVTALRRLHLACDLILTCLAFVAAGALDSIFHNGLQVRIPASFSSVQNFIVICAIWGILIYRQKQSYVYRTKPVSGILRNVLNVVIPGMLLFVFWLFATKTLFYGRFFFLAFVAIDSALLIGLRLAVLGTLHHRRKSGINNENVIVVGTGDLAKSVVDDLKAHPEWGFRVTGLLDWKEMTKLWRYQDIPLIGSLSQLPDLIRDNQVDYVVFAVPHDELNRVDSSLMICEEMGTRACLMADFFSTNIAKKEITEFLGRPAIVYNTTPDCKFQITIKNVVDRVGATLGLLVVSPIMVAVAALVKLTSRGPMFFKQERCGINGKRFWVFKFRTMVHNAEALKASLLKENEMDGPAFKIEDDPRITRIGKLLRKLSVDELPQLINVARGEMSLVGPRPPLPDEVGKYSRWQRRRLSMKPGITCLWQVGGRNDTTFDEWMKLDLQYIDNWSLWLDTKILLKTVPTVINATGR